MPTKLDPRNRHSAESATTASTSGMLVDDRRAFERIFRPQNVLLIGSGCEDIGEALIRDISAGGLFVQLPSDRPICVGQRYDVHVVAAAEHRSSFAAVNDESWSATVIRTERTAGSAAGTIGAAMRFDQPIYL